MAKETEYYRELGQRIQRSRMRQGLTQENLASLVGLSRTSIVNIERGRQKVLVHTLVRLARVLKAELSDLAKESTDGLKMDALLKNLSEADKKFVRSAVTSSKVEQ